MYVLIGDIKKVVVPSHTHTRSFEGSYTGTESLSLFSYFVIVVIHRSTIYELYLLTKENYMKKM